MRNISHEVRGGWGFFWGGMPKATTRRIVQRQQTEARQLPGGKIFPDVDIGRS